MADTGRDVKAPDDEPRGWKRVLAFVDSHPRCGWYVMAVLLLNTLLNLLDLFH
jgi:hypothetical protein